jgi:2'-hydroxyisoflavone reductase
MKILVIGGTLFLGRHIVAAALEAGHEVTLFNRGQHNPELFPGAEKIHGDRDKDISMLEGRRWEVVIDTCGYFPRVVRKSAELLAGAAEHYTFVSSLSVYPDFMTPGQDETAPVGTIKDETVEEITNETYGPLKALCDQLVLDIFLGRSLVVRPGLIVGPYDQSDRFTYWPHRVSKGGEVVAPGRPDRSVLLIDVRDLAEWVLRMAERRATGTYNADGPDYPLTMERVLETCKSVSGSDARFVWVDDKTLVEADAGRWMEIPLWIPEAESEGFFAFDLSKAIGAGLTFRPIEQTVRDTLEWLRTRPAEYEWRAGLSREKEAAILALSHEP